MQRIQATLPALGTISVDFYNESSEVLSMMGKKELSRLRKVAHLGIVSSIFTGANHSREEYMLLQCAVVGLLSKLHKTDENFALSSRVKLNGIGNEISSGEELLKIWSLLGNYGHTKFTYGVERGLLKASLVDSQLFEWITKCKNITDIKKWCQKVIKDYQDTNMHYVICLARFQYLRERKFYHYIRNLVLPVEDLFPHNKTAQYKINRLRDLFKRVRMLCMSTLDSYYSHQPINIQLNSAILGLAEFTPPIGEVSRFEKILVETNSWLAEELYLHPRSCAATKSYELKAEREIIKRFSIRDTAEKRKEFFLTLINSGVGIPDDKLAPLLRLKFENTDLFDKRLNLSDLSNTLQEQVAFAPHSYIATNINPFNENLYVDIIYRSNGCNINDIARIYKNLFEWLIKLLNQTVLKRVKRFVPANIRSEIEKDRIENYERFFSQREIENQHNNIFRIFNSFISYILPLELNSKIKEFVPKRNQPLPILVKLQYKDGEVFDRITNNLKDSISENPDHFSADRLQELRALYTLVKRSKAKFILVCYEKFIIHELFNEKNDKDEWDGIMLEIFEQEIRFTIIEAKNYNSSQKNENKAYKQLENTRKLLAPKLKVKYKRQKIKNLGAYLRYYIPVGAK